MRRDTTGNSNHRAARSRVSTNFVSVARLGRLACDRGARGIRLPQAQGRAKIIALPIRLRRAFPESRELLTLPPIKPTRSPNASQPRFPWPLTDKIGVGHRRQPRHRPGDRHRAGPGRRRCGDQLQFASRRGGRNGRRSAPCRPPGACLLQADVADYAAVENDGRRERSPNLAAWTSPSATRPTATASRFTKPISPAFAALWM